MDMYWRERASCLGEDPEIFHYPVPLRIDRKPSGKQMKIFESANVYCKKCPVKTECLAEATIEDRRNMVRGGVILEWQNSKPDYSMQVARDQERVDSLLREGVCPKGHEINSLDDIETRNSGNGYIFSECLTCRKERNKKYQQNRRDRDRAARMGV